MCVDNVEFILAYLFIYGVMDALVFRTPILILAIAFSIGIENTELTAPELAVGLTISTATMIYTRFYYEKKYGYQRWAIADGLTLMMMSLFLPPAIILFIILTEERFALLWLRITETWSKIINKFGLTEIWSAFINRYRGGMYEYEDTTGYDDQLDQYPVLTVFLIQMILVYTIALLLNSLLGFDLWRTIPFIWRRWEILTW